MRCAGEVLIGLMETRAGQSLQPYKPQGRRRRCRCPALQRIIGRRVPGAGMPAPPFSHHEILDLVEPFARLGLRVDLAASGRLERRLAFRPVEHPTDEPALAGLQETLQLESFGTGHLSPDPDPRDRQRPASHRSGARAGTRSLARAGARAGPGSPVPPWARLRDRLELRALSVGRWPRGRACGPGARDRTARRWADADPDAVAGARRGRRPHDRRGSRRRAAVAGRPVGRARLGLGAAGRVARGLEDQAAAARRQRAAHGARCRC